jgi:AbrB family looped-hinge helix DNA binding protein
VAWAKILARGQVTLPREIREAAAVQPGDHVVIRVTEDRRIERIPVPRLTLSEALERYRIDEPIDDSTLHEGWKDDAVKDLLGQ